MLHSIHDRPGSIEVPSGGFCVDLVALSENPVPVNYSSLKPGINWLIRMDWSNTGGGTIPIGDLVDEYIKKGVEYALKSSGFHSIILGNEPNHEGERPGGMVLQPEYVAWVFSTFRNAVKTANPQIRVITPGIAPYHANPTPWREYLNRLLGNIEGQGGADGIAIHAYARSMDPAEATSEEKMGPPLQNDYRSFRTYLDALSEVPASMRDLPAYITEFNVIPDWEDRNTGIVKAVYNEIKSHNAVEQDQQVHALAMFRWIAYEGQKWGIENKPNVIQDFREAVDQGSGSVPDDEPGTIFIPTVSTGEEEVMADEYPFYIDQEAVAYGVEVVPAAIKEGDSKVWKAVEIQFLNKEEAQGRRHFYFDTVDENGNRVVDVAIQVWWPSGMHDIKSEAKPGEPYSANFPFTPGKNAFNARILGNIKADTVTGAGMGQETPSGFNPGIHTCVFVKYQRFNVRKQVVMPPKPVKPTIDLVHPVVNPNFRVITQHFGENPQDYARFGIKGHTGMDFATPMGSLVQSADVGQVLEAGELADYGKYIKLKHKWGESLYAHLSEIQVQHGEMIGKGEKIALSGSSGNSTGPHLHFAMRINPYRRDDGWAGFSDPEPYLYAETEPVEEETYTEEEITRAIKKAAAEFGIPWQLLASLAFGESSYDPLKEGGGLFQITDDTWYEISQKVGVDDIDNPLDNARVGAYYLKYLIDRYGGNLYKALYAYNWGMSRVDAGKEPPALTREHAHKVLHGYELSKILGVN